MSKISKVLMIYTGGTIGMLAKEEVNPLSPLVPANWKRLQNFVPSLKHLPIEVVLKEMDPIDSSDMNPDYWVNIARVIRENYENFDGFLILHGTDTMAYTASALSFLLDNLNKPVIITGSRIPIASPHSDAIENLLTSLKLASPETFDLPLVPEVCIFFGGLLLRGNRARKIGSSGRATFRSPNFPPLGEMDEHITIDTKLARKPSKKGFLIHEAIEKNVFMFDIYPGIKPEILDAIFGIEGLRGVVLKTFGAGNAPTSPEFLAVVGRAIKERALVVVNVTQCLEGMVEMGLYEAGAGLLKLGVIGGADMTPEAALVKMQFLLGMGYDIETVKQLMQKDLRGEQSFNVFNLVYEKGGANKVYEAPARQMEAGFRRDRIVKAHMRIDDATLPADIKQAPIELAVFMNYPIVDETTSTDIPQCLGVLKSNYNGEPVNLILDCTEKVRQVLNPDRPVQIALVSKVGHAVKWEGAFLSLYTSAGD